VQRFQVRVGVFNCQQILTKISFAVFCAEMLQQFSPYKSKGKTHIGNKRKPMHWFSHGYHGSGITCGRVHTTTTAESCKMAAILQLIGWQQHVAFVRLWCLTSMLWLIDTCHINVPLTSITWPCRRLNFRAHRRHVFFKVDCWPSVTFRFDRGLVAS